jgi:methyl-accepting chemotaxis protein
VSRSPARSPRSPIRRICSRSTPRSRRRARGTNPSPPTRGFAVVADEVRKLAESASRTVEQTRSAFDGLAASIEDVSACITRVAQATEEVSEVASNTSAATQQVSAAAEQSGASTGQVAATSNELAGFASDLDRLVRAFSV